MAARKYLYVPPKQPESMVISFTLLCTSDGAESHEELSFAPPPDTIGEIMERLQSEFSIPKCLQTITTSCDQQLSKSDTLKRLYLRTGDHLTVRFLARADVEEIKGLVGSSVFPMVSLFRKHSDLLKNFKGSSALQVANACERGLSAAAFTHWIPWERLPRTEANRRFLVQEKGIDLLIELYTLLLRVPWKTRHNQLQSLELCCLNLLWNFGETFQARKVVIDKGGFNLMMRSLCHPTFLEDSGLYGLIDMTVGCISNYIEVDPCQLTLLRNKVAMNHLLTFAVEGSPLNMYTKMLAGSCFLRLSFNLQTHQYLASPSVLQRMLQFCKQFERLPTNITIQYTMTLMFARLCLLSGCSTIEPQFKAEILSLLQNFSTAASASAVVEAEDHHQFNWITVFPFLEAAYVPITKKPPAPPAAAKEKGSTSTASSIDHQLWEASYKTAVFALEVETGRKSSCKLLEEQNLVEYALCLPWYSPEPELAQSMNSITRNLKENTPFDTPSLVSMTKAKLAKNKCGLAGVLGGSFQSLT